MRVGVRTFLGPPLGDLFPLGALGMTPSVSYQLTDAALARVIEMHAAGQWADPDGLLAAHDQQANERVLADRIDGGPQGEILSYYQVKDRTGKDVYVYVITNLAANETTTVVCLPEER